ncbi:MAG TPA: ribose-5-phosphate isomerase RpiA [Candidatus Cybelea sp.]|nr:ribose-5-phosphate isomerase RpiA [Candidatus Cybelea sp.]
MKTSAPAQDASKRAAAEYAAAQVMDGMILGLGSGSTAELALAALAERVAQGLRIAGIPTSERTVALARKLGVPLSDFATHRALDLTIDGADQVERGSLNLIKGLGGALLREKIVAAASARMMVVVDETKVVDRLGGAVPVPVEIVRFGYQSTLDRLTDAELRPKLRVIDGAVFVTDGGNLVADCHLAAIEDAAALQARIKAITGVVETGLFLGLATEVVIGRPGGVDVLGR